VSASNAFILIAVGVGAPTASEFPSILPISFIDNEQDNSVDNPGKEVSWFSAVVSTDATLTMDI
jgi:hypothetical protein